MSLKENNVVRSEHGDTFTGTALGYPKQIQTGTETVLCIECVGLAPGNGWSPQLTRHVSTRVDSVQSKISETTSNDG